MQSGADKGPVTIGGDALLSTLDPATASQVKALAEGRMALPNGMAMRSPVAQHLLALTAQYDPTFDVANAPARVAARKAFTSGKQGQNITSFNTAIGHLGTLAQSAEALHNWSFTPGNAIGNGINTTLGDPRVTNFNTARDAVADELVRAFKGTGGNVHEIEKWEQTINSSNSPEQLRGAIAQASDLLNSRIGAMKDSYNAAMGTTDQPLPMLNEHASQALAQFKSPDYLSKGYGAAPSQDQQPPVGPVVGATPPGGGSGPTGGGGGGDAPPIPSGPTQSTNLNQYNPDNGPSTPGRTLSTNGQGDQITAADRSLAHEAQQLLNTPGTTRADFNALTQKYGVNPYGASLDSVLAYRNKGGKGAKIAVGATKHIEQPLGLSVQDNAPTAAALGAADSLSFGTGPKIGAGLGAVSDKLTGADNRSIGDIYTDKLADAHDGMGILQQDHPYATLAGNAAGFIGSEAGLAAGATALGGKAILNSASRLLTNSARGAVTARKILTPVISDAAVGGLYGAGSQDHLEGAPGAALKGAGLSAVGGILGRGSFKVAGSVLSPVADAGVQRLTKAGVTLTPGQILGAQGGVLGKTAKLIEDGMTSIPLVGNAIKATRYGGEKDFNRAAVNDALAPIAAKLPDSVEIGHAAIEHARETVSTAYDNALSSMSAVPDPKFSSDIAAVQSKIGGLSADHERAFKSIYDTDIAPYVTGKAQLDGADLQSVKRGLDKEIASYGRPTASPQDNKLAERLGEVRDAVLDMAGRTNPQASADFAAADRAHALLSRVENAASKSNDGIFTPNQFRQAVTKRGYGTTTRSVASGNAPMQQLSKDASAILPSTLSDSGTATRAGIALVGNQLARGAPGAALGGSEGYRENGVLGALGGAAAGSLLFSRPGAKLFQGYIAGSRGKAANTLGALVRRNAALGGAVGSPLLLDQVANRGN